MHEEFIEPIATVPINFLLFFFVKLRLPLPLGGLSRSGSSVQFDAASILSCCSSSDPADAADFPILESLKRGAPCLKV